MSRFLVMDVVFYGSSLNYDQGSGNYQELKKITRWDGRQYTLVSRYALRYSMLNDTDIFRREELAPGTIFEKETDNNKKGVFNPRPEVLFNGEILKYPEFDLFGYLVTKSEPTQSRTAPVRISHAISMTPFYYDSHFNGNHWIAQRALKAGLTTKLEPNLFTVEEHHTYYLYTVVVDVDRVGKFSIFTTKIGDIKSILENLEAEGENKTKVETTLSLINKYIESKNQKKKKKEKAGMPIEEIPFTAKDGTLKINGIALEKIEIIPVYKPDDDNKTEPVLYEIHYDLGENVRKERVLKLVEAVLELTRNIKGRSEKLKPKLLVLGIYKDKPYDTYKDGIQLIGEFEEEEYVEIEEKDGKVIKRTRRIRTGENSTEEYTEEIVESKPENSDEKTVQVKRKRSVSKKKTVVFEIEGLLTITSKKVKSKKELICYIEKLLFNENKECPEKNEDNKETSNNENDNKIPEVIIFEDPSVEVRPK